MNTELPSTAFHPERIRSFYFSEYSYSPEEATLFLRYRLDSISFTEKFIFEGAREISAELLPVFDRACRLLHIIAGISYYKAALPENISFESYQISQAEADFYTMMYRQGLGEFAFRNNLSLDTVVFPAESETKSVSTPSTLPTGIVVPLGGGKDSLVTVELLKKAGIPFSCFVLGSFPVIEQVATRTGQPLICVKRQLAPELFELNKRGALNGHVPISAIIAGCLTVSALLYGFDTAVLSNERSADAENIVVDGIPINHQFSKSFAFERAFRTHLETLQIPINYFSLLRPLSELAIAKKFADCKSYDQVFTSCNKMFKIQASTDSSCLWCGHCPKCLSTFLCLAPFVERDRLLTIFSTNPLADATHIASYAELCGLSGHKPFECVIDYDEACTALMELSKRPDWSSDAIIRWFLEQKLQVKKTISDFLPPTGEHAIPETFKTLLYEDR